MKDEKFTDEQIIKALKCIEDEDRILCEECAFSNVETAFRCRKFAAKAALDLINRQKAEIDELKAKSAKWTEHKDEKYTCIAGKSEEQRLLHLVNKLTEEVERLKAIEAIEEKEHQYCKDVCYPKHKEKIAMLTKEKDNLIRTYKECMVSAIKEFAERLLANKEKPEFPWDDFYVTETAITDFVKELTEEQNDQE